MIVVEQEDWSSEKRQKFRDMMDSATMSSFLSHLTQKRDACIAAKAWSAHIGQPGDAAELEKTIRQIDGAINVLTMYAREQLIPGSVKILTKT